MLRMRFDDLSRATRSHTLHEATARTETFLAALRALLAAELPAIRERGLTLIGITYTNLTSEDAIQLALPFDDARAGAVDASMDRVRERFGSRAVTRAVLLGRGEGISVPLLPD
jgi:DNA polymerase-4